MPRRKDVSRYLKLVPLPELKGRITNALSDIPLRTERVGIDQSLGRVSAENVLSPADVPATPTSAMDGYAIRSAELKAADVLHPVFFTVKGSLHPCSVRPDDGLSGTETYYVATGAPVPPGADAVVKVEETRIEGGKVSISFALPKWKNVVQQGEDIRAGSLLVERGQVVNPAMIALLISAGRSSLTVSRRPKIGILSTGDELTVLGSGEKGKRINNYSNLVAGYLREAGAEPLPLGVAKDEEGSIARIVAKELPALDALVTIGGTSVGTKDYTPNALQTASSFKEVFHGVKVVPVRPTGMFMVNGKPVILLPGHAVAAALSFAFVVRPVVNILSGLDFDAAAPKLRALLSEDLHNPRPLGAVFLLKLAEENGEYMASPLRWGSNLLSSLALANAYALLDSNETIKKGEVVLSTLLGPTEISRVGKGHHP